VKIETNTENLVPRKISGKPPGAYRALHTADWHLGKMLGENSREQEHGRFLDFLLHAIREQNVDLLVIEGVTKGGKLKCGFIGLFVNSG